MNERKRKSLQLKQDLEEVIQDAKSKGLDAEIKVGVYDINTGIKASVNGDKCGWAASIIKLPVMISTLQEVEKNHLSLKTELPINHKFMLEKDDYVSGLPEGSSLPVLHLLYHMIVSSDNEATNILANEIGGPVRINKSAKRLGLKRTMLGHLLCPGVPRYTSKFNPDGSNITNPDNMVRLMRHIYDPSYFKISEGIKETSDYILSLTKSWFLNTGKFKKSKTKSKIGFISDDEDGDDIHEIGIIDDSLIVCLMANKIGQNSKELYNEELPNKRLFNENIQNYSFENVPFFEYNEVNLTGQLDNKKLALPTIPSIPKTYNRIMKAIGKYV